MFTLSMLKTMKSFEWLPVMRMTQYVMYFRHQYVAVHILRKANFQRKLVIVKSLFKESLHHNGFDSLEIT